MSAVGLLLNGPERPSLRRLQHWCFLAALLWLLRTVRRLGLAGCARALLSAAAAGGQMVPGVAGVIEAQLRKEEEQLEKQILGDGDPDANLVLPRKGLSADEVLGKQRELLASGTEGFRAGQKWGGIYYRNTDLSRVHSEAWTLHSSTNSLFPGVFPCLRKYEAEVVSMTLDLVHGHEAGAVGLLASGGTESILLAALAYRNSARQRGIQDPEILCGVTAHPAIYKACHYFGMTLTKLPVDEKTFQLRPDTVRRAITKNTVAIYASAPTFTQGVVDPIEELGALAQEKRIGLHVDNCLGGFLLSFLSRDGEFTRKWDFSVPGVTTMSIDVHKYGFASKGSSVVAFRSNELRGATYVPSSDGCEGLYVTPTLQGARNGANIAVAWATLMHLGCDGYRTAARRVQEATRRVKREVAAIPELALLVDSDLAIVPIRSVSPSVNIYQLAWLLEQRGWNMFTGQHPPCMSMCLGEQTTDAVIDRWVSDLKESLKYIREHPEDKTVGGNAAVYGAAASTPPELMHRVMRSYVDLTLKVKPLPAQQRRVDAVTCP
eukprot:TRINITY_DN10489_c0_g2_i1.p1 TRINITY_DN10489_c0_g2~~TRINITY_DN10489_c0_g2_i1.p1  ORF type:complete len:548 (+),score=193.23 TRINITY_DN10489_c0_g2_i1:97-1740(+)